MSDLAKRLLACPRFRWMPRMRVFTEREGTLWYQTIPERFAEPSDGRLWLPDLTDPATLGCLLALVREVYRDPNMTLHFHSFLGVDDGHERGRGWTWLNHGHEIMPIGWHKSEAEALVAALEAA